MMMHQHKHLHPMPTQVYVLVWVEGVLLVPPMSMQARALAVWMGSAVPRVQPLEFGMISPSSFLVRFYLVQQGYPLAAAQYALLYCLKHKPAMWVVSPSGALLQMPYGEMCTLEDARQNLEQGGVVEVDDTADPYMAHMECAAHVDNNHGPCRRILCAPLILLHCPLLITSSRWAPILLLSVLLLHVISSVRVSFLPELLVGNVISMLVLLLMHAREIVPLHVLVPLCIPVLPLPVLLRMGTDPARAPLQQVGVRVPIA